MKKFRMGDASAETFFAKKTGHQRDGLQKFGKIFQMTFELAAVDQITQFADQFVWMTRCPSNRLDVQQVHSRQVVGNGVLPIRAGAKGQRRRELVEQTTDPTKRGWRVDQYPASWHLFTKFIGQLHVLRVNGSGVA